VYQVTESPEDARELAAVRVTCHTTLPTIVFPRKARGRKIPSANASADKTDNGCRRRDENSPEIQRAGKLSRSRSTNFRQNKPTPREVSGVVKSRAVNRVISRWHVLKKKKKENRGGGGGGEGAGGGAGGGPRGGSGAAQRRARRPTRVPRNFKVQIAANNIARNDDNDAIADTRMSSRGYAQLSGLNSARVKSKADSD